MRDRFCTGLYSTMALQKHSDCFGQRWSLNHQPSLWKLLESMQQQCCPWVKELRELVSSIADFTKAALSEFLAQQKPESLVCLLDLDTRCFLNVWLMCGPWSCRRKSYGTSIQRYCHMPRIVSQKIFGKTARFSAPQLQSVVAVVRPDQIWKNHEQST
jgi:hypothetical protein